MKGERDIDRCIYVDVDIDIDRAPLKGDRYRDRGRCRGLRWSFKGAWGWI